MRVLVLGGYGNFGARICRALAADSSIELLVGGRDATRATAFATALRQTHGGQAIGVAMDARGSHFAQALRAQRVELLIHTAGPFQGQDYAVAQACAQAGVHYIDLADGRRFVCDFASAMHAPFAAANRVAITGASTVPALSSAVVDFLCQGWQRVDTIDVCIAPAQTAPRGVATLEAVLSYCGVPVQMWSGGQWQAQIGWGDLRRVQFQRLKPRLGAVCDIPDLELFPAHYQVQDRMEFRAAVEVGLAQRAFAFLAWLRQRGLLKNPSSLARLLNVGAKVFDPLGSALGGHGGACVGFGWKRRSGKARVAYRRRQRPWPRNPVHGRHLAGPPPGRRGAYGSRCTRLRGSARPQRIHTRVRQVGHGDGCGGRGLSHGAC